jgi:ferrous iron transport protein B
MFAMYAIGLVMAPFVALLLKRTLLRGETPIFVLEMPVYYWPSPRTVLRRVADSAGAFVRRAGTVILASMIVVWALLYFPFTDKQGRSYEDQIAYQEQRIAEWNREAANQENQGLASRIEVAEEEINRLQGEWKRQSVLGRTGKALEPIVAPLGWDWRIGMAALASFPAREVIVGTLGIIYNTGQVEAEAVHDPADEAAAARGGRLRQALAEATWENDPRRKVFTVPVALSLMVFFALCCQCASTLAVIRRETGGWRWPLFTFVYMTGLAYLGALMVYQVGRWL